MEIARISKGDFGKRHCNTEMSTVIPINLKSAVTLVIVVDTEQHTVADIKLPIFGTAKLVKPQDL